MAAAGHRPDPPTSAVPRERLDADTVLDRIADGILALDRDFTCTFVNRQAAALFPRSGGSLLGRNLFSVFPEALNHPFHQLFVRALERQEPQTLEEYFAPWERWFEARVYPASDGLVVFFTEVTERKRAQRALHDASERLRLAVQAADIGLWEWDLRTRKPTFLEGYARHLGYDEDALPPDFDDWQARMHPDDVPRVLEHLDRFLADPRTGFEEEFRMRHRDGSWRWIYSRADVVRDATGQPLLMVGCQMDVTSRRRDAEDVRRSREQLRALAARLANLREEEQTRIAREVHDELGQMLTGLKMDLRWLQRALESESPPQPGALLERVLEASELADATVRSVQRIATQLRPAALDRLGLDMALRQEAARVQADTGARVTVHVGDGVPALSPFVATACYRVCQEAATNVIRHARATQASIELQRDGGDIVLTVRDNGAGFPANAVARERSLGVLGMRERARQLAGRCEIEANPGGGTIVSMRFPIASAGIAPP